MMSAPQIPKRKPCAGDFLNFATALVLLALLIVGVL